VNARRVTGQWAESTLTHNTQPTNTATNAATVAAGAGADKSEIALDVKLIMADVAAGGAWYGFRVDLTQDAEAALRSSEDGNPSLRPVLEITYSETPDPPDRLAPSDADAVSATRPVLRWQATEQTSYQVQVATDAAFTSLSLDTGKVAGSDQQLDTATTSLPAIATGATRYWRVKVWNTADIPSDWSAAAEFTRQPLAALAITSPGATVEETTPPIVWTFAATQTRYRVTLERIEATGPTTRLWQIDAADASLTRTPPSGLITTGPTYRVTVEAWDDIARDRDEHSAASVQFTYVPSGVPAAPTGLTAAAYVPSTDGASPAVILEWHRSAAPDYWALAVDGALVPGMDRIDQASVHVSGDLYRLYYWGLAPRVAHTLEIQAVVQSGAGAPLQHSSPNPTATITTQPIGIWIVDDSEADADPGTFVQLLDTQDADLAIGEAATTYTPVGTQAPVRITDQVRGYEGGVGGTIHSDAGRDALLSLKARQHPLRLILQHLSFPIYLEGVSCEPTPIPGDPMYVAAAAFFQVGDPWPVV
jgi:hypothetical protein